MARDFTSIKRALPDLAEGENQKIWESLVSLRACCAPRPSLESFLHNEWETRLYCRAEKKERSVGSGLNTTIR